MTTFKELFPLQVVINLDKRPDRLAECRKEFQKINIDPIRKAGILYTGTDNPWWNGAIGCMLSHYQVLQAAACLNVNVFIFEDDVYFGRDKASDTAFEIINEACNELNEHQWDMFYLGGNLLKPAYQITNRLAKLTHCQSTVAYGINKNFLDDLLRSINLGEVTKPIDMVYADDIIPNHNCFIAVPMVAIQRDSFSDIEGKEVKYSEYLVKRYWNNLIYDKEKKGE